MRDARHKFASQSEGRYKTQADIQRRYRDIFNKTGINYNQGNIFINVISMKRETLTALFIDNFKEAIRSNNDLLEGEITIDIDKKYIRFKSRSSKNEKIYFIHKEKVNYFELDDALANKFRNMPLSAAYEAISGELSNTADSRRHIRIAVVLSLLPNPRLIIKELSFMDKVLINELILAIEPLIALEGHLINYSKALPTPWSINIKEEEEEKTKNEILVYPAKLNISKETRDNVTGQLRERLKASIESNDIYKILRKIRNIKYDLEDRRDKYIVEYSLGGDSIAIKIDDALAIGMSQVNSKELTNAFQLLIHDILAHAVLYTQGKDKWEVYAERAEYYKEHPEEFLILTDVLTSGKYKIIEGADNFKFKAPEGDMVNYLTILRINASLREFKEKIGKDTTGQLYSAGRKYFERFNEWQKGSKEWPSQFQLPIETNWLVTGDEVLKARRYFLQSAENLRVADEILKKNKVRIKVAVIVGMHKEKSRLTPPDEHNPFNEDSVRKKISQLDECFSNTNIDWELIFVSHSNSPDKSGKVVEDLLLNGHKKYSSYYKEGKVRSLSMTGPGVGKGGKVLYGAQYALRDREGSELPRILLSILMPILPLI